MEIRWEVYDGYVGKSRPQYVNVPDDEILDCDSQEEILQLIDEYVRDDFINKITYGWNEEDAKEKAEALKAEQAKKTCPT